jgi:hypothetical protein
MTETKCLFGKWPNPHFGKNRNEISKFWALECTQSRFNFNWKVTDYFFALNRLITNRKIGMRPNYKIKKRPDYILQKERSDEGQSQGWNVGWWGKKCPSTKGNRKNTSGARCIDPSSLITIQVPGSQLEIVSSFWLCDIFHDVNSIFHRFMALSS